MINLIVRLLNNRFKKKMDKYNKPLTKKKLVKKKLMPLVYGGIPKPPIPKIRTVGE